MHLHASRGVQTYAHRHTQKHKHTNVVAVPPTCYVTEQTSPPITITGPDLHHKKKKKRKGPTQRPRGLVRNPQVRERNRQKEGKPGGNFATHHQDPRFEHRSAVARLTDSRSSVKPLSRGSPGLSQAAPSLAVGRLDPLCGEADDIRGTAKGCCRVTKTELSHQEHFYFSCLMDLMRSTRFFSVSVSVSVSESRGSLSGTTLGSEVAFSCTCRRQNTSQ